MFFDRTGGLKTPQTLPSDFSSPESSKHESLPDKAVRRRRMAALSLAAAVAVPALLTPARVDAEDPPKTDAPAPAADAPKTDTPAPAPAADAPKTDTPAPAPAVDAPKLDAPVPATTPAAPADTAAPQASGRELYIRGRDEYRKGDWIAARKDFEAAISAGYSQRPSIFEDAAGTYLERMDKKENADRLASAAAAPTAAAPTPTVSNGPHDSAADAALNATARAEDLQRQQASVKADQLVKDARDAETANHLDEAAAKYAEAVHLNPSNAAAQHGLDEVLTLQGRNPNAGSHLEETLPIRKQEINYRFDESINEAKDAIKSHNWGLAEAGIQRAELASGSDRALFNAAELRRFDDVLKQTNLALTQEQERVKLEAIRSQGEIAAQQIQQERARAEAEKKNTIASLRKTAIDLTQQARYHEAIGVVDQILQLDPNDDYARGVRPMLADKWQFQANRNFVEMRHRLVAEQENAAEEKMIPYDDILRYPTDWPDISTTRDQTVQQERGENKEDRVIQAKLDGALPELTFDGVGFSDVVDFLRDVSGANIFVNWKSLETAGIDRNAPVSAKLRNIKFSKALSIILDSVGGGTSKLTYTIDDGVITISTAEDLAKNTVTRVYDIRDLIINIPDFSDAPDLSLSSTSNNQNQNPQGGGGVGGGGQQGGGQGGNQSLFGGAGGGAGGQQEKPGPTRQELVDSITKLITDTVAPESWRDAGGTTGSIRELQGQLIVTQTPENQKQLHDLLDKLREERAIQVTVETRFLTVQRNFLEDVGVDLNMTFNLNGSWSKNISPITLTNSSSKFTLGPTTSVPGSIGGTATALTTSATYLDDFQVALLLRATEASLRSTFVQAPRVTLFNGQRAYVLVSTQQAYVSNLTATVGTGVSAFAPTVSIVQSGVILDVTATVSADRKYVTLTLRPQLATLLDLASFTFQTGAVAGGGILPGTGIIGSTGTPSGTIQEPEIQIQEVKTTVSVPDGGTLLLGGQTLSGETEKEAGVPVLSKVPFLKRLFTNRSMAKDEQILLILVKPTIIIEKEVENKQFPLLTSKLGG